MNRSDKPRSYPIFGTRMAREVIHHPDVGRIGSIEGEAWRMHRADDGAPVMKGKSEQVRPLMRRGAKADRGS